MFTNHDSLRVAAREPRNETPKRFSVTDAISDLKPAQPTDAALVKRSTEGAGVGDSGELSRLNRSARLPSRVKVAPRSWDITWLWMPTQPEQPTLVDYARRALSKTSPWQRGFAAATAIGLVLAGALTLHSFQAGKAVDPERQVVSLWLDAQVAGGTGSDFLQPRTGSFRMYFHSLQSWQITSRPRPHQFLVEATSETPAGELAIDRCQVTVAGVVQPNGIRRLRVVDVNLYPERKPQK